MLCAARYVRVTTSGGRPSAGRGASFGLDRLQTTSSPAHSPGRPRIFVRGVRTVLKPASLSRKTASPMAVAAKGCGERFTRSRRGSRAAFGRRAEAPCPSCHVETRHVFGPHRSPPSAGCAGHGRGPRPSSRRVAHRPRRRHRSRTRTAAGRGEVASGSGACLARPLPSDGAFLEQKVECRGVHFAELRFLADLRLVEVVATQAADALALVTTSSCSVPFRSEASNVPPPRS